MLSEDPSGPEAPSIVVVGLDRWSEVGWAVEDDG